MYRKMKAETNEVIATTMPHLECVEKITKLPVVEMVVNQTSDMYDKVKGSSSVANWTLTTAEATLHKVAEQAAPMAKRLEQPIHMVDQTLCRGLAALQDKVPMVKDEPQEILAHAKGYMSSTLQPTLERVTAVRNYGMETASSIKDYGWNKANDMLATKWGTVALSGFDMTANMADKCIDYYLPAKEGSAPLVAATGSEVQKMQVDPKDKMSATLHTVGRISGKASSRVYQATMAHVQGLKRQSEESISSIGSVLELIPSNMRVEAGALSAKVNALWTQLSSEEQNGEGNTEEQRAMVVARRLASSVAAFCAQVPGTLAHLMPEPLTLQMEQTAKHATALYENLMTSSLRDISESVQSNMKEQATKVQASLQEFNTYAVQLMDALVAKNKELTEEEKETDEKEMMVTPN